MAISQLKKQYSMSDAYRALVLMPRALRALIQNRKKQQISPQFVERLMLAVTEVNGCAICSYAHTGRALSEGLSNAEIQSFLSGSDQYVVPHEARAILFAQHYADQSGRPSRKALQNLVEAYGADQARAILGAIQVIMVGNVMGIPFSALGSRIKGRPYNNSSLHWEVLVSLSWLILLPVAFAHGALRALFGKPNSFCLPDPDS